MEPKRILIVEDDSDPRLAYHILLKVKGCETFFAKDPLSCLCEAHRHQPDLILLDIGLAAGDGFRAMEQLKDFAHLGTIPIVIVSGRSPQECEARALQCGARAYLQKPIDQNRLLAIVAQLTGESGESQEEGETNYMNARRQAEADT